MVEEYGIADETFILSPPLGGAMVRTMKCDRRFEVLCICGFRGLYSDKKTAHIAHGHESAIVQKVYLAFWNGVWTYFPKWWIPEGKESAAAHRA